MRQRLLARVVQQGDGTRWVVRHILFSVGVAELGERRQQRVNVPQTCQIRDALQVIEGSKGECVTKSYLRVVQEGERG